MDILNQGSRLPTFLAKLIAKCRKQFWETKSYKENVRIIGKEIYKNLLQIRTI
jgi:hypothetical protein